MTEYTDKCDDEVTSPSAYTFEDPPPPYPGETPYLCKDPRNSCEGTPMLAQGYPPSQGHQPQDARYNPQQGTVIVTTEPPMGSNS